MAHNPTTVSRKSKTPRSPYPSRSQQVTDNEPPKEKVPKMISARDVQTSRRGKSTSQIVPNTATKIAINDLHRLGVCQIVSPSVARVATGGAGGATSGQKYHRDQSYTSSAQKTTRTTSTAQKLSPKESRAVREQTETKDFKNTKEYKDLKEAKTFKEHKEPHPKGADRSPNLTHRHSRHQSDRTKNYFDKYLKFAFDLSTPEGVKQLEAHFFPDKDPNGTGTSNNREE